MDTCSVAECTKPVKRKGLCYGHYMKDWRYGTTHPTFADRHTDITGQRFGSLVARRRVDGRWLCACDCGTTTIVRIGDLNRGTTSNCGDRTTHRRRDDIGYSAAHDRVRTDRGLVQNYECIECGKQAEHWSYDHADPDELLALGLSARPVAYSIDPQHYAPRCVRCHRNFDLGKASARRIPA